MLQIAETFQNIERDRSILHIPANKVTDVLARVAYTSLSLTRSSTYLRSASVNWTLRLLLKVGTPKNAFSRDFILVSVAIDINRCQ